MVDHIEIARQFVREHIDKRNDVLGALLLGSAARGEATETSDIDIALYIKEDKGEGGWSLTCWKDGVFLEAGVVASDSLSSLDEVMKNPITATHLNDALILYDPTGFLERVQKQVRPIFMQKRWLLHRLEWESNYFQQSLVNLREAIGTMDQLKICKHAMAIPHVASAVPLFIAGINPSSTRKLFLLKSVRPRMREIIVHYECSFPHDAASFMRLHRICTRYHAMISRTERGGLPDYIAWKAKLMMEKGTFEEAIDMLWFAMGVSEPLTEKVEEAQVLVSEWLRGVGWGGEPTLTGKLKLAELLQNDLREMIDRCI